MQLDLIEVLEHVDPSALSYQEWVNVGMALKEEGYSSYDWERWSQRDTARYHPNECHQKWESFAGSVQPVTGGTIVQMAKDQGWQLSGDSGHELDWNDTIMREDEAVIIDRNWIEGKEIEEPEHWKPVNDLITYLEVLFDSSDNVGYVTRSWKNDDGKYVPTKGCWDRTAGQLIEQLSKCRGDIGSVLGDYNEEVGAWIRFNPLDGNGVKNSNVTDFRYALVESDEMEIEKQNAVIRELELPVACLVHSGKKSLHAIVRIDAADYKEYRKRVDYLYTICKKNGLELDSQNRNPSRLSRMPGVMRNGKKQFLIDTNIGKADWNEWFEWIESINDDLPDPVGLEEVWDNMPALSPPLIDGVLRQGHKMLIAGPSKAGKSFALIEMCIAIAEGREWLGWSCTKGKVMYVNLELDEASCFHRFEDVYRTLGYLPQNISNIDIWNLRGKSIPMDKLAPKLIRRAAKKNYIAVVIDPIYKVITGDENSADQMANFCNQFDKICSELGTAVIYCHHHSKGSQGSKRAMDRASGSGVFARDPDALLDLIELELNEDIIKQKENNAVCEYIMKVLEEHDLENRVSQDDMCSQKALLTACKDLLKHGDYRRMFDEVTRIRERIQSITAWRIDGTLREFKKFAPVNLWFDYPVHRYDSSGVLKDIDPDDVKPQWQKAKEARKSPADKKKERMNALETAYEALKIDGEVTVKALEEYFTLSKNAVKNRIKEHPDFDIENGVVIRK